MKAIVERGFKGAHDGHIKPVQINPGDVIEGELATLAVAQGWARRMKDAPENKAVEAAPQNRFRGAGVDGRDGADTGERAKPERKPTGRRKTRPAKG